MMGICLLVRMRILGRIKDGLPGVAFVGAEKFLKIYVTLQLSSIYVTLQLSSRLHGLIEP